jgi:hypothetical protein
MQSDAGSTAYTSQTLTKRLREFSQFQHVGPISFAENAQNGRATAKPETTR